MATLSMEQNRERYRDVKGMLTPVLDGENYPNLVITERYGSPELSGKVIMDLRRRVFQNLQAWEILSQLYKERNYKKETIDAVKDYIPDLIELEEKILSTDWTVKSIIKKNYIAKECIHKAFYNENPIEMLALILGSIDDAMDIIEREVESAPVDHRENKFVDIYIETVMNLYFTDKDLLKSRLSYRDSKIRHADVLVLVLDLIYTNNFIFVDRYLDGRYSAISTILPMGDNMQVGMLETYLGPVGVSIFLKETRKMKLELDNSNMAQEVEMSLLILEDLIDDIIERDGLEVPEKENVVQLKFNI